MCNENKDASVAANSNSPQVLWDLYRKYEYDDRNDVMLNIISNHIAPPELILKIFNKIFLKQKIHAPINTTETVPSWDDSYIMHSLKYNYEGFLPRLYYSFFAHDLDIPKEVAVAVASNPNACEACLDAIFVCIQDPREMGNVLYLMAKHRNATPIIIEKINTLRANYGIQ